MDGRDRAYFGRERGGEDQIGFIDPRTRAIFGRSYAAEPDALIEQLKKDEAIAEADTLLLTVPNQLGVDYCAHVIDSILTQIAPPLAGGDADCAAVITSSRCAPHHQRSAWHQPRGLRHHLQAPRHHRVGVIDSVQGLPSGWRSRGLKRDLAHFSRNVR